MRPELFVILSARRPLQPEAFDWGQRVNVNGGTVSVATLQAVSEFVSDCKAESIWDKLNRVNLFCGDGLSACLVPLKVGGGSATDTNVNFVAGDYAEGTGLTSDASTKYLNTGLIPSATLTLNNTHLAVYNRASSGGGTHIGAISGAASTLSLYAPWTSSVIISDQYGTTTGRVVSPAITFPPGLIVGSRPTSTEHAAYRNGASLVSNATSEGTLPTHSIFVFATNNGGTPVNHAAGPLAGYSIGEGMSASEVAAYNTIMEQFQDAL